MNNPRRVALDALDLIERGGAYANLASRDVLAASELEARDRHLVTELVHGTTRMRRACDHVVDRFLERDVSPRVRNALRLGAHQLLFMATPAHAAVSETVAVSPKPARGLVNAVLRRVSELGRDVAWPDEATRLSYPDWIVDRLRSDLGSARAMAALEQMNAAPEVSERPDGYVQDPASQWVAAIVGARPGERVLDLCAAPGGKATALASTGASVVAADLREHRARVIVENAGRLRLDLDVEVADGTAPPHRAGSFDRVLVDAPCTGLGVLRRRPDARWRIVPDDVGALASLQRALVAAGAELVRPGGSLTYSVCTLTAAETVDLDLLPGWERCARPGPPWERAGPGARLLPQAAGTDGMYVATSRRPS